MEEKLPEILSEDVQEIMNKPPKQIIRSGISIMFFVIFILITGSWFIKYPDIISAEITVSSAHVPVSLVSKASGKITHLFVNDGQIVQKDAVLAVIENPASYADVLLLDSILKTFNSNNDKDLENITELSSLLLSDIQQQFQSFQKNCSEFIQFRTTNLLGKKTISLQQQFALTKQYYNQLVSQEKIQKKEIGIAKKEFIRDSTLFSKNLMSEADFDISNRAYLQHTQSGLSSSSNLIRIQMELAQLEQQIIENELTLQDKSLQYMQAIEQAKSLLVNAVNNWKSNYLFISPIKGHVTFTTIREVNQNITAGDVVFTVVPDEKTSIVGIIVLPMAGAGKVKTGQSVNIKFNNYPHFEFGMVKAYIKSISLVPFKSNYIVEVNFSKGLVTNYGKKLELSEQMTGTAEIITEDIRLIERFIQPLKYILKKQ